VSNFCYVDRLMGATVGWKSQHRTEGFMTIEIRNAELEVLLKQRLKAGNFANVEDMLLHTFRRAQRPLGDAVDDEWKAKALEAAARIREMRKGVTLDRPKGMSLREYAHIGHKY